MRRGKDCSLKRLRRKEVKEKDEEAKLV